MASGSKRCLPSRFPVGTKLVVEGHSRGEGEVEVYSRYIEFPDGTRVRLPPRPSKPLSARQRRAHAAAAVQLGA